MHGSRHEIWFMCCRSPLYEISMNIPMHGWIHVKHTVVQYKNINLLFFFDFTVHLCMVQNGPCIHLVD